MVKRRPSSSALLAAGRDAILAHRLGDGPPPANPYSRGSVAALHFQRGMDRTARLVDQIMDIGA